MSLYDIINDISERQSAETETGDTRVYGVMVGQVASNYHQSMKGRVCVTIPTRDEKANELKWARLAMPSGGKKWGHYFMPEVGDQVLLAFEGGNIERPYIIACVNKDTDSFLTGSANEKNTIKRIVTKNGSTICFDDDSEDEQGSKDKITIQTAGKQHTVLMDNENQKILIKDKDGKNSIEMSTKDESGTLTVKIEKKVEIKVGDNITLTMDANMGTVKLTADTVTVEASKGVTNKTDGMLKLEGNQLSGKANSVLKLESSGPVNVSGSPIKIG